MVPQQSLDNSTGPTQHTDIKEKTELMAIDEQVEHGTVFGSQQVKETSNTPYTDATQVSHFNHPYHKKTARAVAISPLYYSNAFDEDNCKRTITNIRGGY